MMLDKFNKQTRSLAESSKYITLGIETFLPAVMGALIGHYWIDEPGKTPIWTISLTIVGFIVGMYTLFKTVFSINKQNNKENDIKHHNSDNH